MATSKDSAPTRETVGSIKSYVTNLSTKLFNNPDLSDVMLKVGPTTYHAHKFLLAQFSDVLRTMLVEGRWDDAEKRVVTLEETPECVKYFERFLKFMYCGQVDLDIDSVIPLLSLSDKYNVAQIKELCEEYLVNQVTTIGNVRGALKWWKHAEGFGLENLSGSCFDLICESFDDALAAKEWAGLDFAHLCKLLESSDLFVTNEFSLYSGVEKWIQASTTRPSNNEYIAKLLSLIRFPQMTPEELDSVEDSWLCKRNAPKFGKFLYEAFKFHSMSNKPEGKFMGVQFNPRMYGFNMKLLSKETCIDISTTNVCQGTQYLQSFHPRYSVTAHTKLKQGNSVWSIGINKVNVGETHFLTIQFIPTSPQARMKYRIHIKKTEEDAGKCRDDISMAQDTQTKSDVEIFKIAGVIGEFKAHVIESKQYQEKHLTEERKSAVVDWMLKAHQEQVTRSNRNAGFSFGQPRQAGFGGFQTVNLGQGYWQQNTFDQTRPENAIFCALLGVDYSAAKRVTLSPRVFVYQ